MTDELLLEGDGLRGFRTVMAVCAEALLNLPTEDVVANVRSVAEALGDDGFDDVVADAALEQRYYDRFFVSAHPLTSRCAKTPSAVGTWTAIASATAPCAASTTLIR